MREFDVRQRPAAVHRDALAGDDSNVLGGCYLCHWDVACGHMHAFVAAVAWQCCTVCVLCSCTFAALLTTP